MTSTNWAEQLKIQMLELLTPYEFIQSPSNPWYFQRGNIAYSVNWDHRESLFWASVHRDVRAKQSVSLVSFDLASFNEEPERYVRMVLDAVQASLSNLPPVIEDELPAATASTQMPFSTDSLERPPAATEQVNFLSRIRPPWFRVLSVIFLFQAGLGVLYAAAAFLTFLGFLAISSINRLHLTITPLTGSDAKAATTGLHLIGLGFHVSSFGVMVLLIGVYFIASFLSFRRTARTSQQWSQTQGSIIFSSITPAHLSNDAVPYLPQVRYEYRVADQEYIGYRIGFFEGLSHRREALGGVERFARGSEVTVYYNPRRPGQSTLDTAVPRWDHSMPRIGKNLMAIGAVIFVFGLIVQLVLSARSA